MHPIRSYQQTAPRSQTPREDSTRGLCQSQTVALSAPHPSPAPRVSDSRSRSVLQEDNPPLGQEEGDEKQQSVNAQETALISPPVKHHGVKLARDAAQDIIDHDGNLDITELNRWIEELALDNTYPTVANNMRNALIQLRDTDNLQTILSSICEGQDPTNRSVIDLVCNTLGLHPEAKITKTEARQAALSALISELRQNENVGSCFAISLAILIKDNRPDKLLEELKHLLETGHLSQKNIPINLSSFSSETLYTPLSFDANTNVVEFNFDDPSVSAAMEVLNLSTEEQIPKIKEAVSILKDEKQSISVANILKQIIGSNVGISVAKSIELENMLKQGQPGDAKLREKYNQYIQTWDNTKHRIWSEQTNGLLKSFVYSIASLAAIDRINEGSPFYNLRAGLFNEKYGSITEMINSAARDINKYQGTNITTGEQEKIQKDLRREIESVFDQCTRLLYDADMRNNNEERGESGGFALYYSPTGSYESGEYSLINNAHDYLQMLQRIVKITMNDILLSGTYANESDNEFVYSLSELIDNYINDPDFIHTTKNCITENIVFIDKIHQLWSVRDGAYISLLIKHYFSLNHNPEITRVKKGEDSASAFAKQLLTTLKEINTNQKLSSAKDKYPNFMLPFTWNEHVYLLKFNDAIMEALKYDDPGHWVEKRFGKEDDQYRIGNLDDLKVHIDTILNDIIEESDKQNKSKYKQMIEDHMQKNCYDKLDSDSNMDQQVDFSTLLDALASAMSEVEDDDDDTHKNMLQIIDRSMIKKPLGTFGDLVKPLNTLVFADTLFEINNEHELVGFATMPSTGKVELVTLSKSSEETINTKYDDSGNSSLNIRSNPSDMQLN